MVRDWRPILMVASAGSIAQSTTRNQKSWFTGGLSYSDSTYYYRAMYNIDAVEHGGGDISVDFLWIGAGGGGGTSLLNADYATGSGGGAGMVLQGVDLIVGRERYLYSPGAGGAAMTSGGPSYVFTDFRGKAGSYLSLNGFDLGGQGSAGGFGSRIGAGGSSLRGSGGGTGTNSAAGASGGLYGNAGGSGGSSGFGSSAGGGGAGAPGNSPGSNYNQGANGGDGITNTIINEFALATGLIPSVFSSNYYVAGGGGGGSTNAITGNSSVSSGGKGGGGNGGAVISGIEYAAQPAIQYQGSGGGGAGSPVATSANTLGGNGARGMFIFRYLKSKAYS